MDNMLDRVRVRDAMTKNPVVINPESTAIEAARVMKEIGVSALPVVDIDGRLKGIVTERDFVWKIIAEEKPYNTPISEIMTKDLVVIGENETIRDALRLMNRFKVRHLPVIDEKGRLIGILSLRDIEDLLL